MYQYQLKGRVADDEEDVLLNYAKLKRESIMIHDMAQALIMDSNRGLGIGRKQIDAMDQLAQACIDLATQAINAAEFYREHRG